MPKFVRKTNARPLPHFALGQIDLSAEPAAPPIAFASGGIRACQSLYGKRTHGLCLTLPIGQIDLSAEPAAPPIAFASGGSVHAKVCTENERTAFASLCLPVAQQ